MLVKLSSGEKTYSEEDFLLNPKDLTVEEQALIIITMQSIDFENKSIQLSKISDHISKHIEKIPIAPASGMEISMLLL